MAGLVGIFRVWDTPRYYAVNLYRRARAHHIYLLAGGLAFSFFICAAPFVLIALSVLGHLFDEAAIERQIAVFIETVIPYSRYAGLVRELLFKQVGEIMAYRTVAGFVGTVAILLGAGMVFSSMRTVLNAVYGRERIQRKARGFVRDVLMLLLVLIVVLLMTTVMPAVEALKDLAGRAALGEVLEVGWLRTITSSLLTLVLMWVGFFALYYFVSGINLSGKVTAVSALWATVLWELARQAFGYYLGNFAWWGQVYGTFFLLVVVAFWVYYSSLVFILGAEIGALYEARLEHSAS